jgi:predicted DNA-binding transcriptional regulator YafY
VHLDAGAPVLDLLALGAEIEVVHPPELRSQLRQAASQIVELNAV